MRPTSACFSIRIRNAAAPSLNVLPDFYAPGTVEIASIKVNGIPRASFSPDNFQVELAEDELGSQVVVEFRPIRREATMNSRTAGRQKDRGAGGKRVRPGGDRGLSLRLCRPGGGGPFHVPPLGTSPVKPSVSDVEHAGNTPVTLEVNIDFQNVNLEDYAAVIMAANYTSVRLRYFERPQGQPFSADMVRSAPAVQFFARAMANPRIIKGALCHGLWILTPNPELLKGRKVICHEVMLADILELWRPVCAAGCGKTRRRGGPRSGNRAHRHEVLPFVQAIAQQIISLSAMEG